MGLELVYYRVFQAVFDVGARLLPWRKAVPVQGAGSIGKIPELLRKEGVRRPLVVTDPGLVKAGIASRITAVLDKAGIPYALFSGVEANPSVNVVNAIYEFYGSGGCDGIIALGGGSSIDAAKAAAARVARPKKSIKQLGGLFRVLRRLPPLIAIPTTAGTGSETTIAALITDTDHHKYAIMDLCLIPRYAVLDPELTADLPPKITAATGMDALTHAVEAYLCWTYNTRESIRFALEAVKAIFENLETVYTDGKNLEARQAMLIASYKAGFAFTRAGVGNIHAIAHTLGGLYNAPHGLANAVILPVVLEDYGAKVYKKLAVLADTAGVAGPVSAGEAEKAQAFIKAIYAMNERMGIPRGFDFIKDEDIPQMIRWAAGESNPLYPVPVIFNRDRFRSVIEKLRIR
jgi:alcohol dehydrogenase class IV